ncbi:MAG: acyltransferase [Treponema sp.]|nr:acyltransferase [Treponema sp.]
MVIFLIRILGRLYLFLYYGIARILLNKGDHHLLNAFQRALAGKSRLIIAFRHPNGGEPQMLSWFFLFKLRALAAARGVRFARWPHTVCVYSYEVVRWGGGVAKFVMPNVGAMPVHHSKMDSRGMARIYQAIIDGPYPLALAPEGQVSYTVDTIHRLEPGVVRIGFTAAERLAAKSPDVPLEVLPLSIHFRFGSWGSITVEMLLRKIEKFAGLSGPGRKKLPLTERVAQCRDHFLGVNEERYKIPHDPSLPFSARIEQIMTAALETAERMLGVQGHEDFFYRMHRIRQLCWDRIYLPGVESLEGMSPIERSVKDLQASEAWLIARHQELIDFCWYFRSSGMDESSAFHTKVEYIQNLWDFANRSMGGSYGDRVSIFPRRVIIHTAPVINLTERLPAYRANRKEAIATAMADLRQAYQDCIDLEATLEGPPRG